MWTISGRFNVIPTMRRWGCAIVAVVGMCVATLPAVSQWDASGFAAPGPDERVRALAVFDDGGGQAIYAGGTFTAIDGQPLSKVARYQDGVWSPVGGGIFGESGFGTVRDVIVRGDELIVAGEFTTAGGVLARNIAAWDGKSWHALGTGPVNNVNCLVEYENAVIAGCTGSFGQTSAVQRWDGTAWQPVGSLVASISAMLVFNGELIVAGSFSGVSAILGQIARWDGASWQPLGGGMDFEIYSLAIYEGDLIASGRFDTAGGVPAHRIARWHDGEWLAMGEGLQVGAASMVVHESKLIVGAAMVSAGGAVVTNISQWDGAEWLSFPGGVSSDIGSTIVAAMLSTVERGGPTLWTAGYFNLAGELCANHIARYDARGWSRLTECADCAGLSAPMGATAVFDDGGGEALYIAGRARCAGTHRINRVARWDGDRWSSLGGGFDGNSQIMALQVFDDGSGAGPRLYAAGSFSAAGGVPVGNIAMWDGTSWSPVGGGQIGGFAMTMDLFDDGTGPALYVGGTFTSAGGLPVSRIARWNGKGWSGVGGGVSGLVVADMLVWNDGLGPSLVIGGLFSGVGGVTAHGAAIWRNGQWSRLNPSGPDLQIGSFVRTLAAWPPPNGSSLILGGDFATPGHFQLDGLALWNGSSWMTIAPGFVTFSGFQGAHAVRSIRAGGCDLLALFSAYSNDGSFADKWLQVWNGAVWRPLGGGVVDATGSFWTIAAVCCTHLVTYADFAEFQGQLYFVGDFTSAGGQPASNIATWDITALVSCLGDVNGDFTVNVTDLLAVISAWGVCENCPADPSPCGGDGVVNVSDLLTVISQWGPCP